MNGVSFLVLRDHKREFVRSFGSIQFGQVKWTVDFCSFQERVIWNKKKKVKNEMNNMSSLPWNSKVLSFKIYNVLLLENSFSGTPDSNVAWTLLFTSRN